MERKMQHREIGWRSQVHPRQHEGYTKERINITPKVHKERKPLDFRFLFYSLNGHVLRAYPRFVQFSSVCRNNFWGKSRKTLNDEEKRHTFAMSKRQSNNLKYNNKRIRTMKKNVFTLALFCIVSMMANAEVAKYCMSYDDFAISRKAINTSFERSICGKSSYFGLIFCFLAENNKPFPVLLAVFIKQQNHKTLYLCTIES